MFHEIKLLNENNIFKIRIHEISWSDLIANKEYLYKAIADLLLNKENLLYYATQRESSKTLEDTRIYIRKLIEHDTIKNNIDEILNSIGWNSETNVNNTVFQGDLGEYLMSILLDKLLPTETLISKISLKTSAGMPVYGNDNYYYDYENKILYFGESKFYSSARIALQRALDSIKKHDTIDEIIFVKNHTSSFIAKNNENRKKVEEVFDEVLIEDVEVKSIAFMINDDMYLKEDYEKMILDYFDGIDKFKKSTADIILVFFPVLSKSEFLDYFYRRINDGK